MATQVKVYRFAVTGKGGFPVDMLRYDACYPDSSDDAIAISASFNQRSLTRERTVRLRSTIKPPTEGRWLSFGWKVTT